MIWSLELLISCVELLINWCEFIVEIEKNPVSPTRCLVMRRWSRLKRRKKANTTFHELTYRLIIMPILLQLLKP